MESLKHLQTLLQGLQKKTDAKSIILLEKTGQILCSIGINSSQDMTSLAALIVGVSSAGQQLGRLMGENQRPTLVQEWTNHNLLTSFITEDVIVAVFMDKKEKLGFIRFKITQYQAVLEALIKRHFIERKKFVNPLANVTEEELDRLLGF